MTRRPRRVHRLAPPSVQPFLCRPSAAAHAIGARPLTVLALHHAYQNRCTALALTSFCSAPLPEFCPVCATGAALSIDASARVFSAAAGSGLTCNIHGPAGGAFLNVACIGPAPIRSVGQVGRTLRVLVAAFWLLASWSHRSSSALLGPTSLSYVCMGVYRMVSPTIDTFSDSALCGAWLHLAHRRRYRRYLGRRTQSTQCPILEGCGRCVP